MAEREQLRLVLPLAVVLLAGLAFVRLADGQEVALHYTLVMLPVLAVAALLGRLLSMRSIAQIKQIRIASDKLQEGEYEYLPVDDKRDDEFNDLARGFNHMIAIASEREQAQNQHARMLGDLNRRMESVLEATDDGIALLDSDGRFKLVNRRFGELLNVPQSDLLYANVSDAQRILGRQLADSGHLMNLLTPLTAADLLSTTEIAHDVIEVFGEPRRFVKVYTAPVRSATGESTGRIIALHDITRETEVDKMKTEFISVVSHELRTPLTSIKGYTDLLLTEAAGEINDLQREFLGILQGSANRLNNLINDILDISRLESGRIIVKSERVEYEKVVSDTLRLMKAAADEKHQSFDASFPARWPIVRGDEDKITQVLTNLLSNAIKYTPAGGWVKVSMEISGASITTCVADSGIGISPEDQKKLFQKFFRADNSSTREAGGTGLGLAIVKMIVELLGGAIWVESAAGKGSRFYFTLPLYNEAAIENDHLPSPDDSNRVGHDEIEAAFARAALVEQQFSCSD